MTDVVVSRRKTAAEITRDAILAGRPAPALLSGLAAGLLGAGTLALAVAAFYLALSALAPFSTIEGLGTARFVRNGERLALADSIPEGLSGGLSLLRDGWPGLVGFCLLGIVAAAAFYAVGRAKPSWSNVGAFIVVFALCTAGVSIWAYWQGQTLRSQFANRDFWDDPELLDRILRTDPGVLGVTLAITAPVSVAILFLWRWWFLRLGRLFFAASEDSDAADADQVEEAPPSYIDFQDRMRRVKRDSAELRSIESDVRRAPDPIMDRTVVVERDHGRSVPKWMEPVAALNSVLGRPLLVLFVVSLAIWLAMSLVRDRQIWHVQSGVISLRSSGPPLFVRLRVGEPARTLRIFGLAGKGAVDIVIQRLGAEEPDVLSDGLVVDANEPSTSDFSALRPLSRELRGEPEGTYRVEFTLTSGELMNLGYVVGFEIPVQWRVVGVALGLAGAGLIISTFGLLSVAGANVGAYFWR